MMEVKRYGLFDGVPLEETVKFRSWDQGRFVPSLVHNRKFETVTLDNGLSVPVETYASQMWEVCHGVSHLLGDCKLPWQNCLSVEPWWVDSETENFYKQAWVRGGQVVNISRMSKLAYVQLCVDEGIGVVFESASNALGYVGSETRTLPSTLNNGKLNDPSYINNVVRDKVVLLGEDGLGAAAETEAVHINQLISESSSSMSAAKELEAYVKYVSERNF